jgi:hypothetical protein
VKVIPKSMLCPEWSFAKPRGLLIIHPARLSYNAELTRTGKLARTSKLTCFVSCGQDPKCYFMAYFGLLL